MCITFFLAHRCWRTFPNLAGERPEIVFGGSYRGVSLDGQVFRDPDQALATNPCSFEEKRAGVAASRDTRFDIAVKSLDRLILWAKAERREFLNRILQLKTIPKRLPMAQGDGLPAIADGFVFLETFANASPKCPSPISAFGGSWELTRQEGRGLRGGGLG